MRQVRANGPLGARQIRRVTEGRERAALGDQVRVQPGERRLQLQATADEPGGSGEEADPRPRHPVAVRHGHRRDRAIGQLERRQRGKSRFGIQRDRGVGHVVDQQQPVAVGELGERGQLVAGLDGPVWVERIDDADRAGARCDCPRDVIRVQTEPRRGRDRHPHRHAAGGEHRGGNVEVTRVGDDHLVARIERRHQRESDRGLRAFGADDLEPVVAPAPERAGGGVAQRLDQVGGVLVERLRRGRLADRLHRGRRRAAEAGQPAEVGPLGRIEARRALRVDRAGVEAEQRDRVPVGDVIPHPVVARLDPPQTLTQRQIAERRRLGPGQDAHARTPGETCDARTSRPTR